MDNNINFWNRVSKLYTPVQEKANKKAYFKIAELSKVYVENENVLEIASGTGQITQFLANDAKTYVATDYSPKMIEELKKRNIKNTKCEVADATNLNYQDNSFDTILIANALHIMPDPDKAVTEIKRVLKPGGILIAPTFVYDMKVNKFKLFFTKLLGFKTYFKWSLSELKNFLKGFNFNILDKMHIKATPAYIGFIVLENNK